MVLHGRIGASKNLPDSDMQEKKNKRLLVLLFVLLSATVVAYWFGHREDNYEVDKNLFRNYDLKSINEIVLESESGKVALKYTGSRWKVNDQFTADTDMIEVLFATLQQAEPKRPLASSLRDSVATTIRQRGVKISLFVAETLVKTFYAGGNTSKSQAFFLEDDGTDPYLMTIPGYRVYVSGIFELAENGWRDKFVFGFNWRNFQRLEVSFSKKPSDNFIVAMDDNYFSVQGLTQVDTTKLNDFLDNVALLTVDDYAAPNPSFDSLAKTGPFVSILVKDIAKKEYLLQLYQPIGKSRQFPGIINNTQWALFQDNKIMAVVRSRNYFGK